MKLAVIINYFVSIFMLCSPLTAIPVFLDLTQGREQKRRSITGMKSGFYVALILIIITWSGESILDFLGIRLQAFQCAGGIVVFLLALSMLNAQSSQIRQTDEEIKTKSGIAIVPLAMPIMAGPGAMSAVIVTASTYSSLSDRLILTACAAGIGAVVSLLFYFAVQIEKYLGNTGLNILTRVGGLILAALSIEIFAQGVQGLFFTQ